MQYIVYICRTMDVYQKTEVDKKRRNPFVRSYDLVMKNW